MTPLDYIVLWLFICSQMMQTLPGARLQDEHKHLVGNNRLKPGVERLVGMKFFILSLAVGVEKG